MYLGHMISKKGIKVGLQKIKAIAKWPRPTNVTKVWSLLGIVGTIDAFGKIFQKYPTSRQLVKENNEVWVSDKHEVSFQELKKRLTTTPVLTLFVEEGELTIYNDTCIQGIERVLMQNRKVMVIASRQLKPYERNYPTHDLE